MGLDELSDLEEESDEEEKDVGSDEEEEKEEGKEREERGERILKDADQAEASFVSQKKDDDVDALADTLGKTEI